MKILYIVSTLKRSGPTNQLYNIIKYLDRKRFDPYLITLSPEDSDSRWNDFKELGVKLNSLGLTRLQGLLKARAGVLKHVVEIQPDVIHSQGMRGDSISAQLKINIPKLCTIRNFPQDDYPMTYGFIQGKLMLWQHTKAMKAVSLCVGVSRAVRENLQENFSVSNSITIENGVDPEFFYPVSANDSVRLRSSLLLPSTGNIWVSSGHLSSRKNPTFLIRAWKRLFPNDASNHLVFIGDGPLLTECKSEASESNNIHFCGRVKSVAEYLRASDYFVSSSKAEGLPNAVLESLACGLPVVLSNIGPHQEIWNMSTRIGSVFDDNNFESFSSAIEEVRSAKRDIMSCAATLLAEERLSAKKMSEAYQKQYCSFVDGV